MDDLISRQDAIEYFMTNTNWHDEDGYQIEDAEEKRKLLTDYFNGVPSAERKGKWKEVYAETDYRNGWIEFSCECCEYQHGLESGEYGWYYGDEIPWKYCPMCGARMVSE